MKKWYYIGGRKTDLFYDNRCENKYKLNGTISFMSHIIKIIFKILINRACNRIIIIQFTAWLYLLDYKFELLLI